MLSADLLVHNIGQLATVPGPGPKRREALADVGLVRGASMLVRDGRVAWVGQERELPTHEAAERLDAGGAAVVPGFVDPHTHLIFAGDRVDEFEMRLRGVTYQEILAAGGGILSTVTKTRAADLDALVASARLRLDRMVAHGSTTVEAKTGYGLSTECELRMLDAIYALDATHPATLVPTFLPAHAFPPEYRDDPDAYVTLIVEEMLPTAIARRPADTTLFADVFCEAGVFTVAQTERILNRARELGYALKLHSDEFEALGGTSLGVSLGATSIDHLMATPDEEITRLAESETVAVLLPGTTFGLGKDDWARARAMIERGVAVALATDLNPGTAWCVSMPFIMALATRYLRLTPAEALTASTLNAAASLGLHHERGSLTPGYYADFLLLDTGD
ncbi:MAG TPA: imidazolonepropionase, partial [Ardenticatenaceae bacterium]